MTELRELLHERADEALLPPVDLAAIERVGGRRVRRRRLAGAAVAVVAVVGLAAGSLALGQRPHHETRPATPPVSPVGVSWAEGSAIHDGELVVDVGHLVYRYVRTADGFVFTDDDARVWSWHDGAATRVGSASGPLVADPDGDRVAWIGGPPGHAVLQVLDQSTGVVSTTAAPGGRGTAAVIAVDGESVYWRDGVGTVRQGADAGEGSTGLPIPARSRLATVRDGVAVTWHRDGPVTVGPLGRTGVALDDVGGDVPLLSPGARYVAFGVSAGPGRPEVYDTRTGRAVDIDLSAYSARPYAWLDADRAVLLVAPRQTDDYRLEVCSATTGRCRVAVADVGVGPLSDGFNAPKVSFPTGDSYFPYPHY